MSPDPKGFTRKWMLANHKNPSPFKQELFDTIFSSESLQKQVEELKSSIDSEIASSNRVIAEDFYLDMDVYCHKHPHIPVSLNRVILPHSCHNDDSNVVIFVKDLKMANGRSDPADHTVKHYETLFRTNKIDQSLITFMPLSRLFNDYAGYEQRRKLAFIYDQFMVDREVAVKVNSFLGTKLLNDGRAAFPIDFSDTASLAEIIDETLRMVFCMYTQPISTQDSKCSVRIGRQSMSNEQIVDNIIDILYQLQDIHPGGCSNVSKLIIRANTTVGNAIEIFLDESEPTYPPEDAPKTETEAGDADKNNADKSNAESGSPMDIDESLLQKIYVLSSIVPSDSIIPDKEEYAVNEFRRDNAQTNVQTNNQVAPQQNFPALPNIEPQLIRVLKQLIGKTAETAVGGAGGGATANRAIRRRNGRMF